MIGAGGVLQGVQELAPAKLADPSLHMVQTTALIAPVALLYVPCKQLLQSTPCIPVEYFPAAHPMHVTVDNPVEYVPDSHAVHARQPETEQYVPAVHD